MGLVHLSPALASPLLVWEAFGGEISLQRGVTFETERAVLCSEDVHLSWPSTLTANLKSERGTKKLNGGATQM